MKDRLTHLDDAGAARMVDVGDKPAMRRTAITKASVRYNEACISTIGDGRRSAVTTITRATPPVLDTQTCSVAIMLATAGVILLAGTLDGFLVGCALAGAIAVAIRRRGAGA